MNLLDAEDRDLDEWWAAFAAVNNAVFIATLPWVEEPDIIIEGLISQAVRCASYECTETGRYNPMEVRAGLHEMLNELLDIAFETDE